MTFLKEKEKMQAMTGLLWTLFGISVFIILIFGILILRQIVIASELSHHGKMITLLTLILCLFLVIGSGLLLFFAPTS